jgi:hypothetical protein
MTRGAPVPETVTLHVPFRVVKRGARKEMHLPEGATHSRRTDNTLVKALARAFRWKRMLESGEFATIAELAEREGIWALLHDLRPAYHASRAGNCRGDLGRNAGPETDAGAHLGAFASRVGRAAGFIPRGLWLLKELSRDGALSPFVRRLHSKSTPACNSQVATVHAATGSESARRATLDLRQSGFASTRCMLFEVGGRFS